MRRDLERLTSEEFDLLVVGGGIHGAVTAWEASRRGVRVALVEARDFGSGASWNSLKTIHGGLRHLQRLDLGSVRESVREQRALLALAPSLVRPLPFLVPCDGAARLGMLAAGLTVYEAVAGDRGLPARRLLSPRATRKMAPVLADVPMAGAGLWYDAQAVSTERLLLSFLHGAAARGASLANRVRVASLRREHGRACGVDAIDERTGRPLSIRARATIDVSGGGLDGLLYPADRETWRPRWQSAINLVLARPMAGPAIGRRSRGRYLFAVPWASSTLLGTDYAPAGTDPAIHAAEFFRECRETFPFLGLQPSELSLVHHGLVPGDGTLETRPRIVDHAGSGLPGLVSAYPVKYTTARAMAEELLARAGLPSAPRALDPLPAPPSGTLAERARHAVHEEMAWTLADVVLRRVDLGTAGPPSPTDLATVEAAVGGELPWDVAAERAALAATFATAASARARL